MKSSRSTLFVIGALAGATFVARRFGYKVGGNTIVRCRQGHLFTTIWIPGVKLKALDLGLARAAALPGRRALESRHPRPGGGSHRRGTPVRPRTPRRADSLTAAVSQQAATLISALVLVVAGFRFDLYCLRDLARADVVLYFPPEIWFYIIIFSTPFGGIAYLTLGRPR
jgi:hypothetical protein